MWKLCATMSLLFANVQVGQFSDYSITPSNQVGYYYYPAPPKSQQLNSPPGQHLSSVPISTIQSSLSRSVLGAAQTYQNQYQGTTQYANNYRSSVTKQFVSPDLDNAAFNLALSDQAYTIGNTPAVNAALSASSTSSKTTSSATSASSPALTSLNVKLPLPIGVTPLNIAPLPLQAGAPYTAIPNVVTSYGTPYPQRRR